MSILELDKGWLVSRSEEETLALGLRLGSLFEPQEVLWLTGGLGSGKTCLTRGIAQGLGVPPKERVRSPSFSLVHRYAGRLPLFHIDLYRLSGEEALDLGLEEMWSGGGVVVIEWAERWPGYRPPKSLWLRLSHGATPSVRLLEWGPSLLEPGQDDAVD